MVIYFTALVELFKIIKKNKVTFQEICLRSFNWHTLRTFFCSFKAVYTTIQYVVLELSHLRRLQNVSFPLFLTSFPFCKASNTS